MLMLLHNVKIIDEVVAKAHEAKTVEGKPSMHTVLLSNSIFTNNDRDVSDSYRNAQTARVPDKTRLTYARNFHNFNQIAASCRFKECASIVGTLYGHITNDPFL